MALYRKVGGAGSRLYAFGRCVRDGDLVAGPAALARVSSLAVALAEVVAEVVGGATTPLVPFTGYDDMTASSILFALQGASRERVAQVVSYEAAHKGRKALLRKLGELGSVNN